MKNDVFKGIVTSSFGSVGAVFSGFKLHRKLKVVTVADARIFGGFSPKSHHDGCRFISDSSFAYSNRIGGSELEIGKDQNHGSDVDDLGRDLLFNFVQFDSSRDCLERIEVSRHLLHLLKRSKQGGLPSSRPSIGLTRRQAPARLVLGRGQQHLPLGGEVAAGVGLRSQGGNSMRSASMFSGASIPTASVQPPPPRVQLASGVSQMASSALPVSSAGHVALGGGPAAGHVAAGGGLTATP